MRLNSSTSDLARRPFPWLFLVIAFGFTWAVLAPSLLAELGVLRLPTGTASVSIAIAQFGASLAGFVVVYREKGTGGAKRLLQRAFEIHIAVPWLVITLLLPLSLAGIAMLLDISQGGTIPDTPLLASPVLILPMFVFILLLQGPVPEEFGWRGYLLDHLQERWGAAVASVVLGSIWAIWHLPLFFIGAAIQSSMPFPVFAVNTIALSIMITWIYNNSGRNLLAALLFHASTNLAYALFPTVTPGGDIRAFVILTGLNTVVAAILVATYSPATLTRRPARSVSPIV